MWPLQNVHTPLRRAGSKDSGLLLGIVGGLEVLVLEYLCVCVCVFMVLLGVLCVSYS